MSAYQRRRNTGLKLSCPPGQCLGHISLGTDNVQREDAGTINVPIIQGIPLVPTHVLPDRFRSVFPFKVFNAIQSRCFEITYRSENNLVLSSPTGSGKTVIMELAICSLVTNSRTDQYKIVYIAPTKALCSERQRDWQAKFRNLGLEVVELTGDTIHGEQSHVQNSNLIITTPEKWDSITRKWRDQRKLMQLVRLFLIDEVHMLKELRGGTLEAIVSRMKSTELNVRFIALSATVPNATDIATWLGKSKASPAVPAPIEIFGDEFRPVRLQRHVINVGTRNSDFAIDAACDDR